MKLIKKAGKSRMRKKRRTVKRRKTRRASRRVVMAAATPKRRRRRYSVKRTARRRTRSAGIGKMKVGNIIETGLTAAVGAGLAILLTNTVNKFAKVEGAKKNWLFLGAAVALGMIMPKISAVKKWAAPVTMGAVAVAAVRLASETLGMSKYLSLAGDESEELDKIISNLQIEGSNVSLMGSNVALMGMSEDPMEGISESSLLGIAETLSGMEDDEDEDY